MQLGSNLTQFCMRSHSVDCYANLERSVVLECEQLIHIHVKKAEVDFKDCNLGDKMYYHFPVGIILQLLVVFTNDVNHFNLEKWLCGDRTEKVYLQEVQKCCTLWWVGKTVIVMREVFLLLGKTKNVYSLMVGYYRMSQKSNSGLQLNTRMAQCAVDELSSSNTLSYFLSGRDGQGGVGAWFESFFYVFTCRWKCTFWILVIIITM